jgi:hypothetical protein
MDRATFEQFKRDYGLKVLVQESQFTQWLQFFFYLSQELHKEYDSIYQDAFYVKLYELLTEGVAYAEDVKSNVTPGINDEKIKWYKTLIAGLTNLRSLFSDEEFEFIQYKRHSASHIFQDKYEIGIKKNGSLKTHYKDESLADISLRFQTILLTHGSDKNFDLYVTRKLYPVLSKLYTELTTKKKVE